MLKIILRVKNIVPIGGFMKSLRSMRILIVYVWRPSNILHDGIKNLFKGKTLGKDYIFILNDDNEDQTLSAQNHAALNAFYSKFDSSGNEHILEYKSFHSCQLLKESATVCQRECPDLNQTCSKLQSDVIEFRKFLLNFSSNEKSMTDASLLENRRKVKIKDELTRICHEVRGVFALWKLLSSLALLNKMQYGFPWMCVFHWACFCVFITVLIKYYTLLFKEIEGEKVETPRSARKKPLPPLPTKMNLRNSKTKGRV
jgi:hypothetical protein